MKKTSGWSETCPESNFTHGGQGKFRVEPGGLFVGEVFGADLQGPAVAEVRIALAAAVPEGVLLDPAADLIDHG